NLEAPRNLIKDTDAFRHDLAADAISRDDGDALRHDALPPSWDAVSSVPPAPVAALRFARARSTLKYSRRVAPSVVIAAVFAARTMRSLNEERMCGVKPWISCIWWIECFI